MIGELEKRIEELKVGMDLLKEHRKILMKRKAK